MLKKYFQLNTWIVLSIIILIELIFNAVLKEYVLNTKVMYNSLAEQMTLEDIETAAATVRSNSFLLMLAAGVQNVVEIFLITVSINIGILLMRYEISFKQIFNVVTKAFIVFSISRLLLMVGYAYFGVESIEDLNYIPKLSIFELFKAQTLPEWAVFPLQTINIFQILFIILIPVGLNIIQKRGWFKWLLLVLSTYGVALAAYVMLITFLVFL